ncbi:MAG: S6e family ribosomal protein [Candidatus Nanoarchaeia archaeon]|nr:S6e family ribosomal protein [Candidatus Nanoarchaeia archaeon]MDD5588255.1 S6e family ribosomal protein [Candidatus Nanoarchaeia archaeon]
MEIKVVIGTKSGKSLQKGVDNTAFLGKKIKDNVSGNLVGIPGTEFKITGGSDKSGFPMRPDLPIPGRKKILSKRSIGFRDMPKDGIKRKTVHGSIIAEDIAQVNLQCVKGDAEVEKLIPKKEVEAKPEEAKK